MRKRNLILGGMVTALAFSLPYGPKFLSIYSGFLAAGITISSTFEDNSFFRTGIIFSVLLGFFIVCEAIFGGFITLDSLINLAGFMELLLLRVTRALITHLILTFLVNSTIYRKDPISYLVMIKISIAVTVFLFPFYHLAGTL